MYTDEHEEYDELFMLSDDDGNLTAYELLAEAEMDGKLYYALAEDKDDFEQDETEEIPEFEYLILRVIQDEYEDLVGFENVDDEEEYYRVAELFDRYLNGVLDDEDEV